MNRPPRYPGPDVRDLEQRPAAFAGLTERLRRQAIERDRLLLPLLRVPQVEDRKEAT